MQYQIEFLDNANRVVGVKRAKVVNPAIAFLLVVDQGWPPNALTARVVDEYGHCGPSVSKPHASREDGQPRIGFDP